MFNSSVSSKLIRFECVLGDLLEHRLASQGWSKAGDGHPKLKSSLAAAAWALRGQVGPASSLGTGHLSAAKCRTVSPGHSRFLWGGRGGKQWAVLLPPLPHVINMQSKTCLMLCRAHQSGEALQPAAWRFCLSAWEAEC